MPPSDSVLNLYNPATQSPEALLAEFIDRKSILARTLDILRHNGPAQPPQHVILIGPRGMGKTTLLCAIKHSVNKDAALSQDWLPLLFQEEQYGIGDLADFWLETIRHLEAALPQPSRAAEALLDENPADLAERAQEKFFALLAENGRRALLLIDNINDIFENIDDGQALHTLRALWMTDPRCTVVGAAPSYFEAITAVDQAFHDFFRPFTLDRLSGGELENFLRGYAERQGDARVLRIMDESPERVAALRILTGGNPRLVKLGYRVLRDGLEGDLRQDLERLLDEATPFFKHRIDSLKAKETRRVFDAIARRWDPVTVDDIRKELRKPSNYVSAQIKRLIDEGFVEEAGGDKKKRYQIAERFYNVYYLMRHSREGRRRLRWLVVFMQTFYNRSDFKDWAKRLEGDLAKEMPETMRAEKLAHLSALIAAGEIYPDPLYMDVLVRDAINSNNRGSLDAEIAERYRISENGPGYFWLMTEILWMLEPGTRRQLHYYPNESSWWQKLLSTLDQNNLRQQAEALVDGSHKSGFLSSSHAESVGLFYKAFERYEEAKQALFKAIELDPKNAYAWNTLGGVYRHMSQYSESALAFRKAIEIDPEHIYSHIYLGGLLLDIGKTDEGISELITGLAFDPETTDYGVDVLRRHWQSILPPASRKIAAEGSEANNLLRMLTDVLMERAAAGEKNDVRDALLALDAEAQAIFEPLLLALQALDDRGLLYRIAREKRELVLDVMARIGA